MSYVKIAAALAVTAALISAGYGISQLPEHYREQGRAEQRKEYKAASDMVAKKALSDLISTEQQLKKERQHHADDIALHDQKFTQYIADVRAGRITGLRVNRASICSPATTQTASTGGAEQETTARLPRVVEEGLLRFAHDRDQIILDFESFKTEVRVAKCFAE